MSAENEEIIRWAYQRAEEKNIKGFIACFTDDGTFIEAASVNTHLPVRDNQIRSADFLDAEHFPNITFVSAAVREESGRYFVDGDLTIRGTTRPVTLDLTVNGFSPDTFGANRASFSATTTIDRNDFGSASMRRSPASTMRCC